MKKILFSWRKLFEETQDKGMNAFYKNIPYDSPHPYPKKSLERL